MTLDREVFFDAVRQKPFGGSLDQGQVDGMNAILDAAEAHFAAWDRRWLAYCLATTYHETAATMLPIAEYGEGAGQPYGEPDPVTGQRYYGRGFVQLTWADNYKRADEEIGLAGRFSCYQTADNALRPPIAADVMFTGMAEGWFRADSQGPHTLGRYFNDVTDNAYGAREIINGDKSYAVSWAPGTSIGDLIAGYHRDFLAALDAAATPDVIPVPTPPQQDLVVTITVEAPPGVRVQLRLTGPEA